MQSWGVKHRLSSAFYAQSNGRAEIGVKTSKRILENHICSDGSINNDKIAHSILQYHNTPLPYMHLSPAQILFHRKLRDCLPCPKGHYQLHKDWIISAAQREQYYAKRNQDLKTEFDLKAHTLSQLEIGSTVAIYDNQKISKKRWHKTGIIVEVLPQRQYKIKLHGSGRITLRNRRFLRPISPQSIINPLPSATVPLPTNLNTPEIDQTEPTTLPQGGEIPIITPANPSANPSDHQSIIYENTRSNLQNDGAPTSYRIPRALRNLANFNKPGLKE